MSDNLKHVNDLIAKAAETEDSADAMRFSQAALNAANAACALMSLGNENDPAHPKYRSQIGL